MRIAHVIASIREEASGPAYVVPSLAAAQIEQGHDVELHTLAARDDAPDWVVSHSPDRFAPARLGSSKELRAACESLVNATDIVHVHGLWMMPNAYPFIAAHTKARRILSPHGATMPLALQHHAWRKRLFWLLAQRRALRADGVQATSEAEARSARSFGFASPMLVAPIGVDMPAATVLPAAAGRRTMLYLGRFHPIKGLDMLLHAWASLESAIPHWDLVLVGRSQVGTADHLAYLAHELGIERLQVREPMYGNEKRRALAAADVFVLPTRSENFGMAVLESLAHGTPVITTTGAPWEGLVANQCGWWIDPTVGGLTTALRHATAMDPTELASMGRRGRRWAARSFSWEHIAKMTLDFYESVLD